jgi:hypothetical protein
MPKVFLRFSRWLLIGVLFLAIGGHWALLQTVAWASMIVDYSRNAALTEAVEKTFDGHHPCRICTVIQKSQGSEKKHEALQLAKEFQLFDQPVAAYVYPSANAGSLRIFDIDSEARPHAPSVPPPRAA